MMPWQRTARWLALPLLVGGLVTLGLALTRGRAEAWQTEDMPLAPAGAAPLPGEPPAADGPAAPPPGQSSPGPFTGPPPTPLSPEGAPPFAPGVPFVPAEPDAPPEPLVRLRVQAPAQVEPDRDVEYRLTVENVSRAAAHHVLVRDRLPRGTENSARARPEPTKKEKAKNDLTDYVWELGTLKPGERKELTLTVKATGTDDVQNSAYVQYEHGVTVRTRLAKPGAQVRVNAPPQAVLYDPIVFRAEVTNTGAATLKDVVLTDELPAGLEFVSSKPEQKSDKPLTWKLGDVPPGQTRQVEYQAISKKAGTYRTEAKLTAAGGVVRKAAASVTVGEARLSILKTGPQRRLVRRPTPYQITVSNPGTMPVTNVQVADDIPTGIVLLSASPGARFERGVVRWGLGTLAPGEQRTLQVVIRADRPGVYGNEATARADHELTARSRAEPTHFENPSGIAVEIDKSADPVLVGQRVVFTVRLINPDRVAFFRPSPVITVPDALTVVGKRGPQTAREDGPTIRFDPLTALGPGQEAAYTVEVEAKKAGEARLRVQVTDTRHESGPPQVWEEKLTVRDSSRGPSTPPPPALQVRETFVPSPVPPGSWRRP